MEIKILSEDKTSMDIELDSLTIAEILRVYLNKQGAKLAAWKRDHPTKNPVLHIEGDNPKKILKGAIAALEKEIDTTVDEFKKLK
jgi:DNA-directed RNA polymerase subunit L